MSHLAKRIWMALALLALLASSPAPAAADLSLTGANVFDGYLGGYNAYPESQGCGSFHLYFIEGTDPEGTILNDNTSLNLSLSPGTHTFTLLGTEGPNTGLINFGDPSSLPALTLNLSDGSSSGNLTIAHGAAGTLALGGMIIEVTQFTWTPYDQSSVNRVGTCGIGADPWNDAVGQFTIEVSSPPATDLAIAGANVFDGYLGGYNAYPESQGCGIFHLYMIEGTDPNGAILNDNAPLNLSLSPGVNTFTLLGTEGPTSGLIDFSDPSSLPALTLNLSDGTDSGNLTISHGSSGSIVVGGTTIVVTNFSWTPYDQSSVNRVGTCGIGADPWNDAIGHLTVVVAPTWKRSSGSVAGRTDQPWSLPSDPSRPWVTGALALPTDLTDQSQVWNGAIQPPIPAGNLWASWGFDYNMDGQNVQTFHFKGTFALDAADLTPQVIALRLFDPFKADGIIPINDGMYVFLNGNFVTLTGAQFLDGNVAPETGWYRPALDLPTNFLQVGLNQIDIVTLEWAGGGGMGFLAVETISQDVDTTAPVVTAPADVSVEATGAQTTVDIGSATATDDVGVVSLSSDAPATFPVGTTTITYTATDAQGNSASATQLVSVVDTTPPVLTLNGSNPLLLELGTSYTEPGASATDLVDGDLTAAIETSGSVDANTEDTYTITYAVHDAAGNTASASRTVKVLVTANSYGLIATHSIHLRQNAQVHSGFLGVVNRGAAPFLAGKVELVVGTRVQTDAGVRLSAPRVRVRQHAHIDGELVYTDLVAVGKHATIAQQTQVGPSYFPLLQGTGLPAFRTATPGTQNIEVKQKAAATLAPGAYNQITVKQKGTLTFSGGTYHLADLDVGPNSDIRFLAPTILLIRGQLALDQNSTFGPAVGSGIDASDILVYAEGRNGRLGTADDDAEGDDEEDDAEGRNLRKTPRTAKIGVNASFVGNLYAPNGTIHLRQGSTAVGSFIGKDIIVGVRAQVAVQSGWNTPGVIYQPAPPASLAKLAGEQGEAAALPTGTGLLANYPNPFNPSTTVPYVLAEAGLVKLSVYNVLGQQIRVLVDQLQVPGSYTVSWDGMDAAGVQAAGGVYFYRLQAGDQIQVRKMLFAK